VQEGGLAVPHGLAPMGGPQAGGSAPIMHGARESAPIMHGAPENAMLHYGGAAHGTGAASEQSWPTPDVPQPFQGLGDSPSGPSSRHWCAHGEMSLEIDGSSYPSVFRQAVAIGVGIPLLQSGCGVVAMLCWAVQQCSV
jgi:hypothetical protein